MSTDNLDELFQPYTGPNEAHRAFRREFKYLNALYYLFVTNKSLLLDQLKRSMADAMASATAHDMNDYVLGVVTHGASASQVQGVHVPRRDAEVMVSDFDSFLQLLSNHCIIAAHRLIVDFVTDVLIELESASSITLSKSIRSQLRERRLSPQKLVARLDSIGEPITPDPHLLRCLHILSESRNLLEHNNGLATKKYADLVGPPVAEGQPVTVTSRDVGEAFALIETTATALNRRLLSRFAP